VAVAAGQGVADQQVCLPLEVAGLACGVGVGYQVGGSFLVLWVGRVGRISLLSQQCGLAGIRSMRGGLGMHHTELAVRCPAQV
jgi:hypothetical protein